MSQKSEKVNVFPIRHAPSKAGSEFRRYNNRVSISFVTNILVPLVLKAYLYEERRETSQHVMFIVLKLRCTNRH